MATVIRVKRRVDEEPLNAFVLNCKKRKYDDVNDEAAVPAGAQPDTSATVVKFAGTVDNQDDIASHFQKLSKTEAIDMANRVRRPVNVAARNRSAQKQNAQEDRFKIVNCFRTQNDEASAGGSSTVNSTELPSTSGGADQSVTVVDIERNRSASGALPPTDVPPHMGAGPSSNSPHDPYEAEAGYVYDLYLPDANAQTTHMDIFVEDLFSVEPFHEELTYGNARDNGLPDSSEDSEDSNDECNYRNEYPDTEEEDGGDGDSVTERDMRNQFKSMDIDDLSSDDDNGGGGFVYSIDSEAAGGLSEDDVNRYGEAYASYKARVLKQNRRAVNSDSDDDGDRDTTLDSDSDALGSDADNYYSD